MQPDPAIFLLAFGGALVAGAAAVTARQKHHGVELLLWAIAALVFSLAGWWTVQGLSVAEGVPRDRVIVVGIAALGALACGVFLVGLAVRGSDWGAKVIRGGFRKLANRFPWRLRLSRVNGAISHRANPESFERLRELWRAFDAAMDFARNRLADQLTALRHRGGVARVVVQLETIEQQRFRQAAEQLRLAVTAGGTTDADLRRLTEQFSEVADQYARRASDWLEIATNTHGEAYYRSDAYRRFFELHRNACEELHRLQGRGDFGHFLRRHPFFREDALRAPDLVADAED